MVTGSNTDMRTSLNEGQSLVDGNIGDYSLHDELQAMLREQRNRGLVDRGRDLNIFRSGSAPPTVEGSLSAVGGLFRNADVNEINHRSSNKTTNGVLTEDEILSHPAYLSYYYSHENINPRLPPPMLSKEDWRVAQRFQAGSSFGGSGGWERKRALVDDNSSSLFSRQPGLSVHKVESELMELRKAAGRHIPRQTSSDWLERGSDGLTGLSGAGLGPRTKSFADILQEGLDRPASLSSPFPRPASHNAFGDVVDGTAISDCYPAELCNGVESIKSLHSRSSAPGNVRLQSPGATVSHSFPSAVGSSLSRSTTPEPQLAARLPVSGLPPVSNRVYPVEKNIVDMNVQNGRSSSMTELSNITATLSGLSMSRNRCVDENSHLQSQLHAEFDDQSDFLLNMPNGNSQSVQQQLTDKSKAAKPYTSTNYLDLARKNRIVTDLDGQINFPKRTFSSASLYSKVNSSGLSSLEGPSYQNANIPSIDFTGHVPSGYHVNQKLNTMINNHNDSGPALSGSGDGQSLSRSGNWVGSDLHSYMEPHGVHYMQGTSDYATRTAASQGDPSSVRNFIGTSHGDLLGLQKAYLETLLAQQKQQYELPLLGKSGGLNQGYYGNSSYGLGMAYPGNPMANSALPSVGSGNPMFQNDQISCFTSMMRSSMGGPITSWHTDTSNMEGRFASTLLEEFKNNKTRSFELSDIVDHVIEFSTDQYGSRFIQQKLETATVDEKTKIFPEIIPHSHTLMTDVFGNYVIQKVYPRNLMSTLFIHSELLLKLFYLHLQFFEHGTESQRQALASELTGHILPLSLQMYGCRVIQKALEVVDVDRQTQMVAELDGSVMKCVRDQNGNHVIQKCIECVPQDRIQFIISSFYGQVVSLSTHPYGCRVIQRVLEHCDDSSTQQIIMDEIMQSVCILAHDQYGNYVIQHVLQYGKPHERSAIISKLAGQIVKMSQQKFASNVVEKCLTFGGPEERQLLVTEMLGSTDENEPLQIMMKDPFGNYVVQKVIETCDDQTRELILSRIKVHLNTLKRYTYGKHIVSRVEKLIATGERRMGLSSSFSS